MVEALEKVRHQIAERIIPSIKAKYKKKRRGISKTEGDKYDRQIRQHEELIERIDEALRTPEGFIYKRSGDRMVLRPREGHPTQRESVQIPIEWEEGGGKLPSPEIHALEKTWEADPAARQQLALEFFSPEEIAAQAKLKSPQLLAQAKALPKRVTPLEREAVLGNEKLRRRFGDITHLVRDVLKEGDLVLSRSSPEAILRKIQVEKQRAGISFLNEEKLLRVFVNALLEDSVQRLRSPALRREIAKRIISGRKRTGRRTKRGESLERGPTSFDEHTIDGLLKDMAKAHFLEQAFEYTIKDPKTGKVINLLDEMMDTMAELPAKKQRGFIADAVRQVGDEIAYHTQEAHLRAAILDDARSWGMDVRSLGAVTDDIVHRVVLEDRPLPIWLNRWRPKDFVRELGASRQKYVDYLVENGLTVEQADRAITVLRSRIQNAYEGRIDPMFTALKDAMPKAFAEGTNLLESQPTPENIPVGMTGIHRAFQASAGWFLESLSQTRSGLDKRLLRMMKASLTVLNPVTHINNFGANVIYQATRRGDTPFQVLSSLMRTRLALRKYKNGTLEDPVMVRKIRAIERTQLVDSDLVAGEFGNLEFGKGEVGRGGLRKAFDSTFGRGAEVAGKAYSWGDSVFKFDEALRNSMIIEERLQAMSPGESLHLEMSERTWATAMKNADGTFDIIRHAKGQKRKSAYRVGPDRMDEVVARTASVPAFRIFVNYTDVPNYIHWLRQSGLGGFVSPFLTWFYKTMDFPGKRGLVSELLVGDAGVFTPSTSPAINQMQIAQSAKLVARRSMTYNAMRSAYLQEQPEELRKLMKWLPHKVGMLLVHQLSDPGYSSFVDLEAMNSMIATETLFRVGTHAAVGILGMIDADWTARVMFPDILPGWLMGDPSQQGSREALESTLNQELQAGSISKKVHAERMASLKNWDEEIDWDLNLYDEDERKQILARRKLWAKFQSQELATAEDYLVLLGLAGHPLGQAISDIGMAERRGTTVDWQDLYRNYGALFMGALPHRVADIGLAYFDPASQAGHRQFSISRDPKETESFLDFAIRRLVGKYPRVRYNARQAARHTKRMKATLKDSLLSDLKKRRKTLIASGGAAPEELDRLNHEIGRMGEIIGDLVEKDRADQDVVVNHLSEEE